MQCLEPPIYLSRQTLSADKTLKTHHGPGKATKARRLRNNAPALQVELPCLSALLWHPNLGRPAVNNWMFDSNFSDVCPSVNSSTEYPLTGLKSSEALGCDDLVLRLLDGMTLF